jgi:hypothetical protein
MIFKGDEAVQAVTLLNEMNQEFKNAKKDKCYSITKGKYIAFKSDITDIVHNVAVPKAERKKAFLQEYLTGINGYVDGAALFAFIKENKKYVIETVFGEDHFEIKTTIPMVEFKSGGLKANVSRDIEPYKQFLNRAVKKCKDKKHLIGSTILDKEQLDGIKKINSPIVIECNGVRFKATHKLFLGVKAKSEVKVMFFELDRKNNLYLVDIVMDNPAFKSENFFVIVNY